MIRVLGLSAVALSSLTFLGCLPYRPMEYDPAYYSGRGREISGPRQPERFAEKRDVPPVMESATQPKIGGGKPVGSFASDSARIPPTAVPRTGNNPPLEKPRVGPSMVVDPGVKTVNKEESPRELPLKNPQETTELTRPSESATKPAPEPTLKTPVEPVAKSPDTGVTVPESGSKSPEPLIKAPVSGSKSPELGSKPTESATKPASTESNAPEIVRPEWPTLKPPVGGVTLPRTPEKPNPKPELAPTLTKPESANDLKLPPLDSEPRPEQGGGLKEIPLIPTAPGAQLPPALPPVQPPQLPNHQSNFGSPSEKPVSPTTDPTLSKALVAFKADRKEELAEALKKYDAKTQDALIRLLPALSKIYEGNLSGMTPNEVSHVLDQLKNLSLAMTPKAALDANHVSLCREVHNFGHIEPFPESHTFRGGDMVYLYLEMVNFSTPPLSGGNGYAVDLDGVLSIQDAAGQVVWHADPRDEVDRLATPPQDYYRSYRFCLPATLSPGKYTIHVKMVDRPTGREVSKVVPFRVGTR